MKKEVTATEAARNFSDLLNRVRYQHDTFDVTRGGEVIARLIPQSPPATLQSLVNTLKDLAPIDHTFADDLERIQENQPPFPDDPWAT